MTTALALMSRQDSPDALTGRQKVAVLCMALGAEAAAKITQQMPPEEAEAISFEIARMDRVPAEQVDEVLNEWLGVLEAADSLTAGGVDYAREVLERAFGPQKAATMLKRIQSQLADTAGLYRLKSADPHQLTSTLRNEHPQTISLILAHLDPPHTAAVIKELDPQVGSEVVYRMACMDKVAPEMLQLIERTLGGEAELHSRGMSTSGGPAAVAAVLNLLQTSLEKDLLDRVAARDAALVDQIKNLMFVFEDITTLDDKALQRVLREVESKELALALKAASEEVKMRIRGAMSQRAVAALQEEIDMLGPVRVRDVEGAQASIVAKLRKLEEAGEIMLNGANDDVVV